jgi:hypothetical protein
MNGATLTAGAHAAYAFITGLYKSADFNFAKLVPWLRANIE